VKRDNTIPLRPRTLPSFNPRVSDKATIRKLMVNPRRRRRAMKKRGRYFKNKNPEMINSITLTKKCGKEM